MSRVDRDLSKLHPFMREQVNGVLAKLKDEQIPFEIFESYRTPKRQAHLYAQGRTRQGKIVTKANAWQSLHQYGVAVDFVLYLEGRWSWSTAGVHGEWWSKLADIGTRMGLKSLSWEKPHLQLDGLRLSDLRAGSYPDGGDVDWVENLAEMIEDFPNEAPPVPQEAIERPFLVDLEDDLSNYPSSIEELNIVKQFRVIARSGLNMREGPSTEFDKLEKLPTGKIVHVMDIEGGWAKVDVDGDGLIDGYCHRGYLEKV